MKCTITHSDTRYFVTIDDKRKACFSSGKVIIYIHSLIKKYTLIFSSAEERGKFISGIYRLLMLI